MSSKNKWIYFRYVYAECSCLLDRKVNCRIYFLALHFMSWGTILTTVSISWEECLELLKVLQQAKRRDLKNSMKWFRSMDHNGRKDVTRFPFHQHFTRSFYERRSWKRTKLLKLTDFLFALLGSARVKAACKMLMKLTPGSHFS